MVLHDGCMALQVRSVLKCLGVTKDQIKLGMTNMSFIAIVMWIGKDPGNRTRPGAPFNSDDARATLLGMLTAERSPADMEESRNHWPGMALRAESFWKEEAIRKNFVERRTW